MKYSASKSGFALISTLSIMLLIVLLLVALLSLASTTTRSQADGQAKAEAQANAKLALMLALGDLQKQMGPDQRISANGEILGSPVSTASSVNHPHWTGVWDSWIAGDPASAEVNPAYPSAASHHQTIGNQPDDSMRPAYDQKDKHFRKWLLSLDSADAAEIGSAQSLALDGRVIPGKSDTTVRLLGEGSLGRGLGNSNYLSVRLLSLVHPTEPSKITGRFGWWAGDESQKARIMADSYENNAGSVTSAEKIFRSQAPGSMGNKTIPGLEGITNELQLKGLPSRNTLDLISVSPQPANGTPKISQQNFHHSTIFSYGVLADVREGGLKRDLSTLLERPIDPNERSDEFMLYKFDVKDAWANDPAKYPTLPATPQECVPIQDLAAFYQLYDRSRKSGIEYTADNIRLGTPDFGTTTDYATKFQQEYTTLYRNPVAIKIQYLISLIAEPITQADRELVEGGVLRNSKIPLTDTLKLRLAVMPAITMWNPYNVPIVMETGNRAQQIVVKPPVFMFETRKIRSNGSFYQHSNRLNLNFATSGSSVTTGSAEQRTDLIRLNFARLEPITFAPGEVKVFSLPFGSAGQIINYDPRHLHVENNLTSRKNLVDASPGWNPDGYYTLRNSTPAMRQQWYSNSNFETQEVFRNVMFERVSSATYDIRWSLTMAPSDELAFTIIPENTASGQNVSGTISPYGSALNFYMAQRNFSAGGYNFLNLRHQGITSRFGGVRTSFPTTLPLAFNQELLTQSMPGQVFPLVLEPIRVSTIEDATNAGEPLPFLQFALMAGCETSEIANGGIVGGRKFPSRPFLHSSPLQPHVIDLIDGTAPYNHGWNWWVDEMNSVLESLVQESRTGNGFHGGGFSAESGTTHVVQQEIPVTPPISIAALSHARIGGFTLANEAPVGHGFTGTNQMEAAYGSVGQVDDPSPTLGFQRVTATGQSGLFPHVIQAIGNSYANPNLAAGVAFDPAWKRLCDQDEGERNVVFADHSYLANKALWDEFFFSSITPQPGTVEIFGGTGRDATQVASDFFFESELLPNRRIVPFQNNMDSEVLNSLFAAKGAFNDGLADKIAAHLMVEGPFNINSTSVEAWKVLFSSLKGKPIAYLDGGKIPKEAATGNDTPVGMGALPVGIPATTANTGEPRDPEQWKGLRVISDEEIDALALAMVREVKKRGPFLSLSEFVNRRLDPDNPDGTALKGALQAALDYDGSDNQGPEVTINKNFRDNSRTLDGEVGSIVFAFQDAAEGPAAYGSSAYVDQADVLRQFAAQLTPRGDTFVIRTYGDSLDAVGNIVARAWCEAVVQRTPDYVHPVDENHLKTSDLQSDVNKRFGRAFRIVSFRWLDASEI